MELMMETKDKIKEIHDSPAFGMFIETGCGLPVASALFEIAGSSKTVFYAESPYSKIVQDKIYGESKARAVSKENIDRFITHHEWDLKKVVENNLNEDGKKLNFIYASTFQVGEQNDKSTHGWIGIWTKPIGVRYFHISIHPAMSRKEYIQEIARIGIDLLHHCTVVESFESKTIPSNCYIDIALDNDGNDVDLEKMFVSLRGETNAKNGQDNFLAIKDGSLIRLEDLFRDKSIILLYKGSFNPVHAAHIHNAEVAKKKYGNDVVFVISSSIYQKGWVEPEDLKNRVAILNALGYSVIVTKDGFFNHNTEYIREKFNQPLVYVVGSDTMNRILESSYNILNPRKSERFIHFGHQISQIRLHEGKEVTEDDLKENEDMALSVYMRMFKEDFKDVMFFVINRPGSELKEDAKRVEAYYTLVEEHPDYFHISSTKIREMKEKNDIDGIRKLIPEKVLQMYIKTK
jgi:nicotinic acid mononucleotide adenylyltransferase